VSIPSYVCGTSGIPLIGETIGAHFDRAVERWGSLDALVVRHQGIKWTYAELKERVDTVAAGLLAIGVAPGDRVGIWSPNNAEWLLVQLATAKAGIILVNINPAYRLAEVEHALRRSGCRALITAARADYLVTENQRHFPRFWKKTKVITSREFISIVAPHLII
jgi:fatty-acyl-CoA synthase